MKTNKKILEITSLSSPIVKEISKLSNVSYARKKGLFIAEGIRVCKTLFEQSITLEQLVIIDPNMLREIPQVDISKVIYVTQAVMNKISTMTTPPGILAVFCRPVPVQNIKDSALVLVNIQDPGNMGTLIRSAVAFGKKTVICVDGVDPYHPKVVQASAGYVGSLSIAFMHWSEVLQQKLSKRLAALVLHAKAVSPEALQSDDFIVVGSEAHGLPQDVIDTCDMLITIPMSGAIESLNAAVAGSIALYCSQKQ